MLNVFVKKSAEELHVQLFNGRMMPLEDIVRDYERLLKKKVIKNGLKVGEWFRIDRETINKSKEEICHKCNQAGDEGRAYWKRFEKSNKIADENPGQYTSLMETYIFEHSWEYKTEQEMRDMCVEVGAGMCDEVICDLELQMRICNGESVNELFKKADKLPRVRIIKLRNGGSGYLGGSSDFNFNLPPADLGRYDFNPHDEDYVSVPYAFRHVHVLS